jgi:hypothetical protein
MARSIAASRSVVEVPAGPSAVRTQPPSALEARTTRSRSGLAVTSGSGSQRSESRTASPTSPLRGDAARQTCHWGKCQPRGDTKADPIDSQSVAAAYLERSPPPGREGRYGSHARA